MASAVGNAERVLQELSNAEFNYAQTAKAVREYDGINPETDHHQTKEYFAKLKFNFIELETKKEFLLQTARMAPEDVIEPPTGPTETKQQLKEVKAKNAETRAALEKACAEFVEQHAQFTTLLEDERGRVEAVKAAQEEVARMRAAVDAQRAAIGGDPAIYGKAAALAKQAQREREEEEEMLRVERERHDAMAAELERLEAAAAAAREDHAAEARRLDAWKAEEQRRGHERVDQIRWYKEMSQCLANLGSMSLISATVDSLQVRVERPAGVVDVMLMMDTESGYPTSVQLHGAVGKDVQRRATDMIAQGESAEAVLRALGTSLLL